MATSSIIQAGGGDFTTARKVNKTPRTCETCGREFLIWPCEGDRKFCSTKCSGISRRQPLVVRFLSKMAKPDERGCIVWSGAKTGSGYGAVDVNGKLLLAHRVSYGLFKGPIPKDMQIIHSCDNPICVNPEHLRIGTHQDNMDDRDIRDRSARGKQNGNSVLTEDSVRQIRSEYATGEISQRALARKFGVAQFTIWRVVNNLNWAHVGDS